MKRIVLTLALLTVFFAVPGITAAQSANPSLCLSRVVPDVVKVRFGPRVTIAFLPATNCDDWREYCADAELNTYNACWFLGEGDCWCKGMRTFNKCMKEVGCNGYSEQFMTQQNCSMID